MQVSSSNPTQPVSFFQDRLAWKAIRAEVTSRLAAEAEDAPVRVWAPACARGEEAYGIAMLLLREFELLGRRRGIQVFATDAGTQALEQARTGAFPTGIMADLPRDCLERFCTWTADGSSVAICKEIRDQLVFASHNLLTDPPLSRLDLIICRNLAELGNSQTLEKCAALFHYALRAGGYLLLGGPEAADLDAALFKPLGQGSQGSYRIFEKIKAALTDPTPPQAAVPATTPAAASLPGRLPLVPAPLPAAARIIQERLLEDFAPVAVGVDQRYEIVYHNGPTSRYLCQPRGAPTRNLLELLPADLRGRLHAALARATAGSGPVALRVSLPDADGGKRSVILTISRLPEELLLVVFSRKPARQADRPPASRTPSSGRDMSDQTTVRQLEAELDATRTDLQGRIEQLRGLNEELQSTNEELEASREELQSLNEELLTVNARFQTKIEQQEQTNNDLHNFLTSTNIPTLFLDQRFRLRRFTPAMARLLKLLPADVGRPISDLSQQKLGPDLVAGARMVLENLVPVKKEILIGNTWYLRATLPCRTADHRIEGVVVTWTNVSELKHAEFERQTTVEFLHLVNRSINSAELIQGATEFFQRQSDFEAVGIRLRRGDDYPYAETRGFPAEFVRLESSLCARDATGQTIRDNAGNPVLACMCGNVLCGRFDPEKHFFSKAGSFWTNCTTELLATTTEADRQARTRNRCNGEGYESVALIALRLGEERLGLIQLNDRRPGRFTPELILLFERLAGYLAMAIARSRSEEALRHSMQKLAVVNVELESFIYSLSHDLRGPLRSMSTFASFLLEDNAGRLDDPGRDYLLRIKQSAARLHQLINDLLQLSEISRRVLDRTEVDLSQLALMSISALRQAEPAREVEVRIEQGLTSLADRRLLEIVFANLFSNAWKFTAKTERARIEFGVCGSGVKGSGVQRFRVQDSGVKPLNLEPGTLNPSAVYFVRDNGVGFDPRYRDKLFRPFHRLHSDRQFAGTGIGLAMVERIFRLHGGRVWAEGEIGKGATIYFTLDTN